MTPDSDAIIAQLADHSARIIALENQMKDISKKLDDIQEQQIEDVKKTNYTLVVLLIAVVGTLTNVILHFI